MKAAALLKVRAICQLSNMTNQRASGKTYKVKTGGWKEKIEVGLSVCSPAFAFLPFT